MEARTVGYPAPLPTFTKSVAETLKGGNKPSVMKIYSDIVKECAAFYGGLVPTETYSAKISLANIGRTIIETYPVLAVPDFTNPWSYFNDKLSKTLRNCRSRIKRKLTDSHIKPKHFPKVFAACETEIEEAKSRNFRRRLPKTFGRN